MCHLCLVKVSSWWKLYSFLNQEWLGNKTSHCCPVTTTNVLNHHQSRDSPHTLTLHSSPQTFNIWTGSEISDCTVWWEILKIFNKWYIFYSIKPLQHTCNITDYCVIIEGQICQRELSTYSLSKYTYLCQKFFACSWGDIIYCSTPVISHVKIYWASLQYHLKAILEWDKIINNINT